MWQEPFIRKMCGFENESEFEVKSNAASTVTEEKALTPHAVGSGSESGSAGKTEATPTE